jgi:hypothetical protein
MDSQLFFSWLQKILLGRQIDVVINQKAKTREMCTKLFTRSKWQYWKLTLFRQKIATLVFCF